MASHVPDKAVLAWAADAVAGFDPAAASALSPLPGAGSGRKLWRLRGCRRPTVLVVNPAPPDESPNENDSFVYLAQHLLKRGLPVPEVFAYEAGLGACLMEDLGDDDLYAAARRRPGAEELLSLYGEAVTLLARMQTAALEGFDPSCCSAPGPYDRRLMTEGESGYFRRELLGGLLSLDGESTALAEECGRLADDAEGAGSGFFLHRDFQSTNLKLRDGGLWIIDFQGARLGPPQYDVASLLYDPYVSLPLRLRRKLLALYLESAGGGDRDAESFMKHFLPLAAHRLMQALGAYAKLGGRLGKKTFLAFIPPGLTLLEEVLEECGRERFPFLHAAVEAAAVRFGERF